MSAGFKSWLLFYHKKSGSLSQQIIFKCWLPFRPGNVVSWLNKNRSLLSGSLHFSWRQAIALAISKPYLKGSLGEVSTSVTGGPRRHTFLVEGISGSRHFPQGLHWLLTEKSGFLPRPNCSTEVSVFWGRFTVSEISVDLIPGSSNVQRNQQHQCVFEVLLSDTTKVRSNPCTWCPVSLR